MDKSTYFGIFERILRSSALLITGALRTTPSKALFVLMNWLPVDLMAKQIAIMSAIRLKATGAWNERVYGHATVLGLLNDIPCNIDYCIPKPFLDRNFSVSISAAPELGSGAMEVYTDGSKSVYGVGGGCLYTRI